MSTLQTNKELLTEKVNSLSVNLKAEVLTCLLTEAGLDPKNLQTNFTSSFNRTFRNDLYKAEYNRDKQDVNLFISRNGFYDMLPEGLTHAEVVENSSSLSVKNLLSTYKKQKQEETEARLFFKPFENYLFNFLTQIENKEKSLLNNNNEFKNFFRKFWDIDERSRDEEFVFLLQILPYAANLKGNTKKIINLLSHHLNKRITSKKIWTEISLPIRQGDKHFILGQDFVMGNLSDQLPLIEFLIHDVTDTELESYSKNGYQYNFIQQFLEFFLPIELEYQIKINPNYEQIKSEFGILGHSTILQTTNN